MKLNVFLVAVSPGIAAGSLWEFQGEEIWFYLQTSAKGEDLLTGQTVLAGVQKSYIKVKWLIFEANWIVWHNFQNKDFSFCEINAQVHPWALYFFCVCSSLLPDPNVVIADAVGGERKTT